MSTTKSLYPNTGPVEIVLAIRRGERTFELRHRIALPDAADWERFFAQAAVTRREQRELIIEDRSFATAIGIYDACIESVAGYRSGQTDLMELDDWREKVPPGHKLRVLERLAEVSAQADPAEGDGYDISAETVTLVASLNDDRIETVHRFGAITAADLRQWHGVRASRRINAAGEAMAGGTLSGACALYDRLIREVDGYTDNDPARVPALHKKVALEARLAVHEADAEKN